MQVRHSGFLLVPPKFILGENYYVEGKYKEAIEAFETVIGIQDNHGMSHYYLYIIHAKTGNPKKASFHFKIITDPPRQIGKTNLDKLIEIYKQKNANIHFNLGVKYLRDDKIEKAIQEYKIAIRIKEDHSQSHFNLGLAYKKLGSTAEAKYHFQRALELGYERARKFLDSF